MTLNKLFDLKKKAYYYYGQAAYAKHEYADAAANFDAALLLLKTIHDNVESSPAAADFNRIQEFCAKAKKALQKQTQKEKSTWSKAFDKNNHVQEDGSNEVVTPKDNAKKDVKPQAATNTNTNNKNNDARKKAAGAAIPFYRSWGSSVWLGIGITTAVSVVGIAAFALLKSRKFR